MKKLPALLVLLMVAAVNELSFSQDTLKVDSLRKDALKVYFNCSSCDMDYIRKEITFVNYVRDEKDAQLYILISSMTNGNGGNEYSIFFIGQKEFKSKKDTLKVSTSINNTADEIRKLVTQTIKLGIMPYVARTPLAKSINISFESKSTPTEIKDPWKSWVFNINGSVYFSGQEAMKTENLYGSLEATKTTEKFRTDINAYYSYYDANYKIGDTATVNSFSDSKSLSWLAVKSMGEHWSVGGMTYLSSSSYNNIKFHYSLFPAVEYDIFKYSESTRHQLRFLYQIGIGTYQYIDTTIFNKTKETLFSYELTIAYKVIEKWGSISTSVYASQFLKDLSKNIFTFSTSLSIRIFKGLSLTLSGDASIVHDQLSLPKAGATEAEILTQQQQLSTQYTYWLNVGLTYTFGSIYNNVVNPRFGN